jgi:hypothetical protein
MEIAVAWWVSQLAHDDRLATMKRLGIMTKWWVSSTCDWRSTSMTPSMILVAEVPMLTVEVLEIGTDFGLGAWAQAPIQHT